MLVGYKVSCNIHCHWQPLFAPSLFPLLIPHVIVNTSPSSLVNRQIAKAFTRQCSFLKMPRVTQKRTFFFKGRKVFTLEMRGGGDEFISITQVAAQHQKQDRTGSRDCTSCPKLCVDTNTSSPPLSPCMLRRKSLTLSCSDDDEEESSDCNFILDFLVLGSESISLDKRGMKDLGVTVSAEH
jgi:hypothetical protein